MLNMAYTASSYTLIRILLRERKGCEMSKAMIKYLRVLTSLFLIILLYLRCVYINFVFLYNNPRLLLIKRTCNGYVLNPMNH